VRERIGRYCLWIGTAVTLAWAEPSVYGRSYGSGDSTQIKRNKNMIYSLRQQVARQKEEIEGLKSLVESLSQRLNRLEKTQGAKTGGGDSARFQALQHKVEALEKELASLKGVSQRRAGRSADAPKKTRKRSTVPKSTASKKAASKPRSPSLEKAASNKLYSRGVRLVAQKKYREAKLRFDILKKRNYKPAATQFYLGEIAYRTGRYDEAIKHYQKSAELNENAAYMDRLLLHTAIALEKSGEKEQARNFFQAIVDGYPGTSSARIAKKHLK